MGFGVLVALTAGVLIGTQVAIMGRNAPSAGAFTVALLVQVGGLAAALVWMLAGQRWDQVAIAARGWWWMAAGVAGWLVLATIATSASRIGVAAALAVAVAAQLVVGLSWDAWSGGAPVNLRAVSGLVMLGAGVYLVAGR